MSKATCKCDRIEKPYLENIPAGLDALPRQIGTFGDFRQAMLGDVRNHSALANWRARDGEDFGVMILEWWSYVADIISFYTSEHTHEIYLGTSRVEANTRRIVELIGYKPKPAMASRALLAAIVDGTEIVTAPSGTRFISDGIADQPPQEFELESETLLDPLANQWTLSPIAQSSVSPSRMLINPASINVSVNSIIMLDFDGSRVFTKVRSLERQSALDAETYVQLFVRDSGDLPTGTFDIATVHAKTFAQQAPIAAFQSGNIVQLDGLFPQLRVGESVVIEKDGEAVNGFDIQSISFDSTELVASSSGSPPLPAVTTPTTLLTLDRDPGTNARRCVLHFATLQALSFVAPAKHELLLDDLRPSAPLDGQNDPLRKPVDQLLLRGHYKEGAHVPGTVVIDPATGDSQLRPDSSAQPFAASLRTPVNAYANLLSITRGKTTRETLGSGQGAVPFQTLTLSKSPLTYVSDPTAPIGRRSTLRVWVDNVEWHEVDSLFAAEPDDRVFVVDLDAAGVARVTFGGEGFGRPATLGVDNIVAMYRFGAGDPPPPANSIRQVAGPVPGLSRVFNVRPAYGGGPGDKPADVKHLAAASSATFDRAVSAHDFAALSLDFGAINAIATTEWVPERVREGVVVTAIFDGGPSPEMEAALLAHLRARSAEATPIRVFSAVPEPGSLEISYRVMQDFDPAQIQLGIRTALIDRFQGLLSPRNAQIGGPVFRSRVLAAVAKVSGVEQIVSLVLDGVAFPMRVPLGGNEYFAPDLMLAEVDG